MVLVSRLAGPPQVGQALRNLPVPLQRGQVSCRELMRGEVLSQPVGKDQPLMIDQVDVPHARREELRAQIYGRGL